VCVCVCVCVFGCVCVCVWVCVGVYVYTHTHTHTHAHTHTHTKAGEQAYTPDVEVEVVKDEEVGVLVQEDMPRQQKAREDKILALMEGLFFFALGRRHATSAESP
jgi:hypothetical protein